MSSTSSQHSKSKSESDYQENSQSESESENESHSQEEQSENESNSQEDEEEEEYESLSESEPDILKSDNDYDESSDDFEAHLKRFKNKNLIQKNEIKFEIPKDDNNNYIRIARKSDKNNVKTEKENSIKSEKSMDPIFEKLTAFKILNDVNANLDKLEKELNENLKKINTIKEIGKPKNEKKAYYEKEKFENDFSYSQDELSSEKEDEIKIKKSKKYTEKEVNTDVIGNRTAGNYNNNFKQSMLDLNQNYSNTNHKFKNYERNHKTYNNNHFRTVEDLYRNPYSNTQPIIYNRDNNNNLRNSKNSLMNNNNKYNITEGNICMIILLLCLDMRGSQENYIKIQKKNRPQNITQAMDILLNKNREGEERNDANRYK